MGNKRNKVQKVLDATSQEVALLGLPERRELFIVLRRAEVDLSVGLSKWLADAPDGAERFTAQQMRNGLANVRAAIQTIRTLNPKMAGALESVRASAARSAFKHVEYELLQFQSLFAGEIKPPNIKVAALLAKGDRLLLKRHKTSAQRYAGQAEIHLKRQLALGVVKGESWDSVIGRITRLGPSKLIGEAFEPADMMARGLMQLPRSWAARLIRTESIHAYNTFHNETIEDLAKDDPSMRKRWDSSLDRRGCAVCRALDGEVRKVKEAFSDGSMHPPSHPNCRCTVVPWSDDWAHDSLKSTGTEAIDAPDPKTIVRKNNERASAK